MNRLSDESTLDHRIVVRQAILRRAAELKNRLPPDDAATLAALMRLVPKS